MPDSGAAELRSQAARREQLDLCFERGSDGATRLSAQFASYPFHLCKPFRMAGDPAGMATLYLQSCSGGLYEGDRLSLRIGIGDSAMAHVTTQAASIAYGMRQAGARHSVELVAGDGSLAEYLPDPVILFPRARLSSSLTIRVQPAARVISADSFLLHDPKRLDRPFEALSSTVHVEDAATGRLLFRDRFSIGGEAWLRRDAGVTGAASGLGTVILLDDEASATLPHLRASLDATPGIWAGASLLPNGAGALCRILAEDGRALRAGSVAAWRAARLCWTGVEPMMRRK